MKILTINCGSTSIKFNLYDMPAELSLASGKVENIGLNNSTISFKTGSFSEKTSCDNISDHRIGLMLIIEKITGGKHGILKDKKDISAIGHRVVNVGDRVSSHVSIDDKVIRQIKECFDLAPLHNPPNLLGIEVCSDIFGNMPNVAVFDNLFHKNMPPKAYLYGIPYDYYEKYRIRKYGFHGIAYTYMVGKAAKMMDREIDSLRMIALMLGGGSSITACSYGKSIDTSMGFTPSEGLMMSTRCGDIDPSIITFIMKKEGLGPEEIDEIINKKSGYYGLSGKTSNHVDLVKGYLEGNEGCKRAFEAYSYRIKKYIGAYMAVMNGADAIIFGGGIGENSQITREQVLDEMDYLGIKLNKQKNLELKGEGLISTDDSKVKIFVINVDEEIIIARETYNLVLGSNKN
ncbi:MAG: acetate/propionate family kinase [Candidatus Humimicrobiaceae bacterium]